MSLPLLAEFPHLTLERMELLAVRLSGLLAPADTLTLRGDLGAGKTSFARALIQAIAPEETEVTSPTFTLMQSYDVTLQSGPALLWHLDLYRLKHKNEAAALGLEEIWPHVVLIEWPEIVDEILPENRLDIIFAHADADGARHLAFFGNDAWRQRLVALT